MPSSRHENVRHATLLFCAEGVNVRTKKARKNEEGTATMKLVMNIAILVALCCVGLWQWNKKSEEARQERALEYQRMVEKKESEEKQRAAMTTFANAMRQHYADKCKAVERDVADCRKDSARLTEIVSKIMSEKDSKGKDLAYDEKILQILRHTDVNAFAMKYLGSDFAGIPDEMAERIQDTHEAEEKYAAAVKAVDSAYSESMQRAGTWAKMTAQQRDVEFARLNKEIKRLEAKRDKEQKEYKTISKLLIKGDEHTEREREAQSRVIMRRLHDTESEIRKRRYQIDYLRNPQQISQVEANMVSQAQRRQNEANNLRQQAMYDIDRRLKPKKSLVDVATEFETKTVGRLRKTLADKIAEGEKEAKTLKEKLSKAEEFLLAIPVTDLQELKQRKAKLEK